MAAGGWKLPGPGVASPVLPLLCAAPGGGPADKTLRMLLASSQEAREEIYKPWQPSQALAACPARPVLVASEHPRCKQSTRCIPHWL